MRTRLAAVALFWGVVVLSCSFPVSAVTILDYTVTSITASERASLPPDHWAHYATQCDSKANARIIPLVKSLNSVFVNISASGMRVPFYAWNSTPFHLNSIGFLSPTWYGMCDGYCVRDFFSTIKGNYGFSDNTSIFYDGGGDWPMIAFYLAPFETTNINPARSFILTEEHFDSSKLSDTRRADAPIPSHTLVEYCNVPLQGAPWSAAGLTAQVAVYANGTIVMRYKRLPAGLPGDMWSTGLIYSKTLRKVVATPSVENGIVAYRFDPVYDPCDGAATAAACGAMSVPTGAAPAAGAGVDCVWCPSTSACASRALVAEVCPRGQWAMRADEAGANAQRFYAVTVDLTPTPLADLDSLEDVEHQPVMYGKVMFRRAITIFNTMHRTFPRCFPGCSCSINFPDPECPMLQNTCPDGSYIYRILALESTFEFSNRVAYTQKVLGLRSYGEFLCDVEGGCLGATVGILTGIVFQNGYATYPDFSVQLYVETKGIIIFVLRCNRCPDGAPFLAYPPIRVGLVRYGVDDPSSVLV
ncbi:hypothetical protein ABL78_6026, partial [Leptomonas seymouri]